MLTGVATLPGLLGLALLAGGKVAPEVEAGLARIDAQDVRATVGTLTGDAFAGRDTPLPGLEEACGFVARRFEALGLEPLGGGGSFLWRYRLTARALDEGTSLVYATARGDGELAPGDRFQPARRSPDGVAEGDLVFCGYGIESREWHWHSFRGVDVEGKVAVVLAREPRADSARKSFFQGREMTDHSALTAKAARAAERGAVALLVVPAEPEAAESWLNAQFPALPRRGRGAAKKLEIPTAIVHPKVAEILLGASPATLRDTIDSGRRPRSFAVADARVRLEVRTRAREVEVPQVAARYRGADLAERAVIVGAHLDHVGMDDRGRIYRGADDNAAGVAALLEVAEGFASGRPETRRSILFLAFTGEEKGLLGSQAWCADPPVATDLTDAMINLDIVSRGRPRAIEATPPPGGCFLERLLGPARRLSRCGLKVGDGGRQYFQRSDQFSFHQAGVPTLFLNEGSTNDDYHRWTDTADKVLDDKVARVARLAFALAYLAANEEPRRVGKRSGRKRKGS